MKFLTVILASLLLMACGSDQTPQRETPAKVDSDNDLSQVTQDNTRLLTVYKSPTCGCCDAWIEHMEEHGYTVAAHNRDNMHPIKEEAGILPGHGSCHTAFIDGYAIEGHVPAADVDRLLAERPDARGLTVPGMPVGSPGMEMGDRQDPYEVLLFTDTGSSVFSTYH